MNNIAILGLIDFENWNNQNSLSLGGSTGVIKSILPYLVADKIYLLGITSDKSKLNMEVAIEINISIVPIAYIPNNTGIPVRFLTFWYSRKINSILQKYRIDSIYTHAEEMSYWVKPGPVILYHMHGSANALSKAKIKIFRNKIFQMLWERIRIKNIQKSTKIIAIDKLCYQLIEKQDKQENALMIPNFVNNKVFFKTDEKSELLSHIQENILLFVGRIEEVKGLELFVEIVSELNRQQNRKWKGVFVGSGSYESNIHKYIRLKSEENLFFFAGAVFDQNELRKIYNQASVVIISSFFEGIPMAILESLACETPVISTNVGGIKDLVADGINCMVIDNRDPNEFVKLILSISTEKRLFPANFKFSAEMVALQINDVLR